ncbi:hypothetical protein CLTEP_09810 [Clostridium tepidiprofundi DSM 19306]|uniref:Uncharacterized protein n=1 Tax=Clostridium tepidiprofundi DSM 19306 TaxID=1121338 RepID=A0A151B504_9CLOT|nr:hypothetical protein [Clostridium tepidiprofundi]KYH34988.1 hypothetical protein CLTEP_09810 [Clostridium tepidiprofundi DSM 19306]
MFKEVIIKPTYSGFVADVKLVDLIIYCGYSKILDETYDDEISINWDSDPNSRIDMRIIEFIKQRNLFNSDNENIYPSCSENPFFNGQLCIKQVDTSRPWVITEYDSAESISYLTIVNKDINYFSM